LLQVGELHRGTDDDVSRVWLLDAADHLEQRRLAHAVRPDDAEDAAGRDFEREIVDERATAEALGHVPHLDHLVAEARSGRDAQLDRVERFFRALLDELLVAREPRLRARRARLRSLADPLELAR